MTPPRLIVVTDFERFEEKAALGRIARLLALGRPGSVLVQLREHARPIRERLALGRELGAMARAAGQLFGVNDRIDLALAVRADALHLGERSVKPADARALTPSMWISRAGHDPTDLAPRGADAILLSPIFAERHGRPALGIEALASPTGAALYAFGGVTAENARACLLTGATGVAVVGAALGNDDPRPLLEALGIA